MSIRSITDTTTLNNGVHMPWLGLGVWQVAEGQEVISSVEYALKHGYRSIDTAAGYQNETGVGTAIKNSGIPREELFITTKLANKDQGYESTLRAFEESRSKLGLEYIDLYLIHWPGKDKYKETWKAFEKLYQEGLIRAIGVSNFKVHHLESLAEDSGIVPAVNQVEFHPLLQQQELLSYCKQKGMPVIADLAQKYGKTPAQIILRWDLQLGVVTIPKSIREARIQENAGVFDFTLSDEDMQAIARLNQDSRFGPDPDNLLF